MRIINLVNISTVLLLINLLQTKSQANGEDTKNGTPDDPGLTKSIELKVEVQALLKDKETNMRVKWNENLLDDTKPEYHQLRNKVCTQFLPFVKKNVLSSQDDGECKDVTFTKHDDSTKDGAVNVKLTITFKDSVAINQKPMDLKSKLKNDFKNLQSESTLKATKPTFNVTLVKPLATNSETRGILPRETEDDDAKKDEEDKSENYDDDTKDPDESTTMEAAENKSKENAGDIGGEDSTVPTAAPATAASANEEKDEGDKDNKDSQHPDVLTSNANDRNVIIALVALMILAIGVALTAVVKQR
uniref:Egg protein CP1531 n=1 Tax=Schistosoma japonicum TaxID=6182 RepID=C7TY34_SCHJA|nr:hypothetical protein [Schistosoma japonicum]CAX82510.1 hypothetical protein [Schistosoma japonicum]